MKKKLLLDVVNIYIKKVIENGLLKKKIIKYKIIIN